MPMQIKRIYEPPSPSDGKRILVDRLWPRGMSKVHAGLDDWMKDIAPSPALRTWFGHRADYMDDFTAQYRHELDTDPRKQQAVCKLLDMAKRGEVTLLYAARDPRVNHAIVLLQYLEEKIRGKKIS